MTILKLKEHCDRTGFTAEVDGDTMTATIFNRADRRVMTVKLK